MKREAGCWVLECAEPEVYADVYGIDSAERGLMFSRPGGAHVMDVIYEVARRAGFAIMPVCCGTLITSDLMRRDLPYSIPKPIVLVESGADLERVISSF